MITAEPKYDTVGRKGTVVLWIFGRPQTVGSTEQARNQEYALGGLIWRLEKTSKNLDPDFKWALIRLSRFFRPKCGDLQKKGLYPNSDRFSVQNEVISEKKKKRKKGLHPNSVGFSDQL